MMYFVLKAAVLCDNVVQAGCAIAKFPKFKDYIFFILIFYKMGKNRVGGSVKLKI